MRYATQSSLVATLLLTPVLSLASSLPAVAEQRVEPFEIIQSIVRPTYK
jgi:hypothetical protein